MWRPHRRSWRSRASCPRLRSPRANCHIVFVEGEEMKAQIEPFFQMLYDANPASVGGALPGEDFYYAR